MQVDRMRLPLLHVVVAARADCEERVERCEAEQPEPGVGGDEQHLAMGKVREGILAVVGGAESELAGV